jgi:hypothetical protein
MYFEIILSVHVFDGVYDQFAKNVAVEFEVIVLLAACSAYSFDKVA